MHDMEQVNATATIKFFLLGSDNNNFKQRLEHVTCFLYYSGVESNRRINLFPLDANDFNYIRTFISFVICIETSIILFHGYISCLISCAYWLSYFH